MPFETLTDEYMLNKENSFTSMNVSNAEENSACGSGAKHPLMVWKSHKADSTPFDCVILNISVYPDIKWAKTFPPPLVEGGLVSTSLSTVLASPLILRCV